MIRESLNRCMICLDVLFILIRYNRMSVSGVFFMKLVCIWRVVFGFYLGKVCVLIFV